MKIIKCDENSAKIAIEVLKSGGLIIYPTETLYGIGADATNPKAIKKLTEYKNRPFGKPYSIAVTNKKMAEKYAVLNKTAKNLYKEFLPGPLTVSYSFSIAKVGEVTKSVIPMAFARPFVNWVLPDPISPSNANTIALLPF